MIKPANGNGNGNGNGKKKPGRPPNKSGVTLKQIISAAIKHDGKPSLVAKELGIHPTGVMCHLKKPFIQKVIQDSREAALKRALITRTRVYKTIGAGLDATKVISATITHHDPEGKGEKDANSTTNDFIEVPDFKERRESGKLCAQLLGDLKSDTPPPATIPFIVFLPPVREIIDVKP